MSSVALDSGQFSPPSGGEFSLVDWLLRDQADPTAVERFAQFHVRPTTERVSRHDAELRPVTS